MSWRPNHIGNVRMKPLTAICFFRGTKNYWNIEGLCQGGIRYIYNNVLVPLPKSIEALDEILLAANEVLEEGQ